MAKKADDEPTPIKVQRKVEPVFKLPPPPAVLFSRPKPDPAEAARLAEERRAFDRDMAIRDGLIEPPWLKRLVERLTQPAPPPAAPPPPEPKTDALPADDSPKSCVDDGRQPQTDTRQSHQGARRAAAQRQRARTVLTRLFPNHDYPLRPQVPDADLWRSFCVGWERIEGARGVSLNLRPSRSTVLREVGRKD
jgi:hypothetical protein